MRTQATLAALSAAALVAACGGGGDNSPPVIVMTAAVPDILRRLPRERVSSIVTKPFDLDQLLREADEAIRKHAAS